MTAQEIEVRAYLNEENFRLGIKEDQEAEARLVTNILRQKSIAVKSLSAGAL